MPEKHKPRAGTLQYWPRKRAARMHPNVSLDASQVETDGVKPLIFAAYKAGMTQVTATDNNKGSPSFNQTISIPATVLDTPPLLVLGARSYTTSGRDLTSSKTVFADNAPSGFTSPHSLGDIDAESTEKIRLILQTQPDRSGFGKKAPEVFEADLSGSVEEQLEYVKERIGSELDIGDVFEDGQFTDVSAVTKGKGFQGVVKRYGVHIRGRKDEKHHRHIGVIGAEGVARVIYTIPQPGQHGFQNRTEFNKRLLKTGEGGFSPNGGFVGYGEVPERYALIKGSVPGPKKRLIFLRAPIRNTPNTKPPTVLETDSTSQQGLGTRSVPSVETQSQKNRH